MRAQDLTIRSLEGLKVKANVQGTHDVHDVINFTVETDMRTGDTVVILVLKEEPDTTSARDFEPHPGFEEFNEWLLKE